MDFCVKARPNILFLPGVFLDDCPREEYTLTTIDGYVPPPDVRDSEPLLDSDSDASYEESDDELPPEPLYNQEPLYKEPLLHAEDLPIVEVTEEIPRYFINLTTWIKSTSLLCANCSNKIPRMPWFVSLGITRRLVPAGDAYEEAMHFDLQLLAMADGDAIDVSRPCHEVQAHLVHRLFCSPFCTAYYIRHRRDPEIRNEWEALSRLAMIVSMVLGRRVEDVPDGEDPLRQVQYCGKGGMSVPAYREANERRWEQFRDQHLNE